MPAQAHEPEAPAKACDFVGKTASEVDKQWREWGVIEVMVRNPCVSEYVADMEGEIENLRAALRAVRGSTDPAWAARLISYALRENRP
jgi:hypothetical protein